MRKFTPFLWYSTEAEEVSTFYAAVFPDSRVTRVTTMPSESPSGPPGSVKIVEFVLFGQPFVAMSAGPLNPFNHAVSFVVNCEDQAEIDRYWHALLEGGSAEQCGWDLSSYPPVVNGVQLDARHIEVKGRVKGATTITVTRNEILYAVNQGEKFVLAIVFVNPDDTIEGPHYVRKPFQREPDWGAASVNYNIQELIRRSEATS